MHIIIYYAMPLLSKENLEIYVTFYWITLKHSSNLTTKILLRTTNFARIISSGGECPRERENSDDNAT